MKNESQRSAAILSRSAALLTDNNDASVVIPYVEKVSETVARIMKKTQCTLCYETMGYSQECLGTPQRSRGQRTDNRMRVQGSMCQL